MTHVATLVCNPIVPILTARLLRQARSALPRSQKPHWLAGGVAADIAFAPTERDDAAALTEDVRAVLADAEVDVIVQAAHGRRKKLLVADMDSTMIGQECIDELAAEIGMKQHVVTITERAMRGEIAFEPALRERVALLVGLHPDVVSRLVSNTITLTPGARLLVQTMRSHGAHTALVSGGFTVFTKLIAAKIGFNEDYANQLALSADGCFSGLVVEPVLGQEAKLATLRQLRMERDLSIEETLAVGDGANDLAMLREAGLGVAFHGKPAVAAAAHARINYSDLTALLYAQGYRRDEFVEAQPRAALGDGSNAWPSHA
jgi:phosphoserine phosphatase